MKAVLLLLLLLGPQLAAAKVYMCRDAVSGKTTFTDRACEQNVASREEVRVPPTNVDSGKRTAAPAPRGAWVSDRDTRKSGRDYNASGGQLDSIKATAGVSPEAVAEEES
jgi:hypothetical protein